MTVGLMAGAGVFVFMVGVSTLVLAALQAIGCLTTSSNTRSVLLIFSPVPAILCAC